MQIKNSLIRRLFLRANLPAVYPVRSTFHVENQEQLNYLNLKRYAFFFIRRFSDFSGTYSQVVGDTDSVKKIKKTRRKIILLVKRGKERRFVTHE